MANVDNPLLFADRTSKRLAPLLRRQPAIVKARMRLPFVEPLIFLSAANLDCKLDGRARSGTFLRGRPGAVDDDGIVAALTNGVRGPARARIDASDAKVIDRAMTEAGIRPSNRHRHVGDYRLEQLLTCWRARKTDHLGGAHDFLDWLNGDPQAPAVLGRAEEAE